MNFKNNYPMTTIAVLYFFLISTYSQEDTNDNTFPKNNSSKNIIPDCIFGVKSVAYVLYTRDEPNGRVVHMEDKQIPLRLNTSIGFFIHGFISTVNYSTYFELIETWLQTEDINVFSVNWDDAACSDGIDITDLLAYKSAVNNVPDVGEHIANFTARLAQDFRASVKKTVIIGHSLGAHIAGFAGKAIQRLTNQKYGQIIGLDPAGPAYRLRSCANRLCKSDAAFVLIYHTSVLQGIHAAIGHDDFYFHGGFDQPACILPTCSHSIAVNYAAISIKYPMCFLGTLWQLDSSNIQNPSECNASTCLYAGLDAQRENARGIFYMAVTSEKPYCSP